MQLLVFLIQLYSPQRTSNEPQTLLSLNLHAQHTWYDNNANISMGNVKNLGEWEWKEKQSSHNPSHVPCSWRWWSIWNCGRTFSPGELRSLQATAPEGFRSPRVSSSFSLTSCGIKFTKATSSRLGRRFLSSKPSRQSGQAARCRPLQCRAMQPRQKLCPQPGSRTGSVKYCRQQAQLSSRASSSRSRSMAAAMARPGRSGAAQVSFPPGAASRRRAGRAGRAAGRAQTRGWAALLGSRLRESPWPGQGCAQCPPAPRRNAGARPAGRTPGPARPFLGWSLGPRVWAGYRNGLWHRALCDLALTCLDSPKKLPLSARFRFPQGVSRFCNKPYQSCWHGWSADLSGGARNTAQRDWQSPIHAKFRLLDGLNSSEVILGYLAHLKITINIHQTKWRLSVPCTSQKVLCYGFQGCRIRLWKRFAEPACELEWIRLCGESGNTGKFVGAHQQEQLVQVVQSWMMMSWLGQAERQSNSNKSSPLRRRKKKELISPVSASIETSLFLQKRTILGILDWLAIVSKRWKPHQKLSLQNFLLICKLRLFEKKN